MDTILAEKENTLKMYNRERLELTSASQVISSTEKEVVAKLIDSYIYIYGTNLTISKLVPEEGTLVVTGTIFGIKYENKINKKSFMSKVFK